MKYLVPIAIGLGTVALYNFLKARFLTFLP